MDGGYRAYENLYVTSALALNRHQHNEDRGRRQHLSHKFSLTPASELRWTAPSTAPVASLRAALVALDGAVPAPLQHARWPAHRAAWQRTVHAAAAPAQFALAMAQLVACIKPAVFNHVWHDSLGMCHVCRIEGGATAGGRGSRPRACRVYRRGVSRDCEIYDRCFYLKFVF